MTSPYFNLYSIALPQSLPQLGEFRAGYVSRNGMDLVLCSSEPQENIVVADFKVICTKTGVIKKSKTVKLTAPGRLLSITTAQKEPCFFWLFKSPSSKVVSVRKVFVNLCDEITISEPQLLDVELSENCHLNCNSRISTVADNRRLIAIFPPELSNSLNPSSDNDSDSDLSDAQATAQFALGPPAAAIPDCKILQKERKFSSDKKPPFSKIIIIDLNAEKCELVTLCCVMLCREFKYMIYKDFMVWFDIEWTLEVGYLNLKTKEVKPNLSYMLDPPLPIKWPLAFTSNRFIFYGGVNEFDTIKGEEYYRFNLDELEWESLGVSEEFSHNICTYSKLNFCSETGIFVSLWPEEKETKLVKRWFGHLKPSYDDEEAENVKKLYELAFEKIKSNPQLFDKLVHEKLPNHFLTC